jgi:hypothetical protein
MPSDSTTIQQRRAPGILWILAVLLSFAVLAFLAQGFFGQERVTDPRVDERLANLSEIRAAQAASVKKMGLETGASAERLAKSLEQLKTLKPGTSTMVVPGSPTQLKQSAAPAAAPAPAPAAAPAK